MSKRVKKNYDRGYVNAQDKIRVFIESDQKVMYISTGESTGLCERNHSDPGIWIGTCDLQSGRSVPDSKRHLKA